MQLIARMMKSLDTVLKNKLMRLMFARYGHKEIENLFRFIEIMLELSNDDLK